MKNFGDFDSGSILWPAHNWKEELYLVIQQLHIPACSRPALLEHLSPPLIPGNNLTGMDLRSFSQSFPWSRSSFTICSFELSTLPPEINSMKLIWLLFYYFCSHRCSNPILNRQLALRQCWSLRSEGSFHTSHACPDNILEDKLLLYPPIGYNGVPHSAYNLWHLLCLFPLGPGLSHLLCLAETIFGR